MSIDKKEMQAYYRDIRKALPCSAKNKRRILTDLQASVNSFLSEMPLATMQDIQSRFGTPAAIADSYAEQLEAGEITRQLDVKKTIIIAVCGTLLAAFLLWVITLAIALVDENISDNGYIATDPIIESEVIE